MQEEHTTEIQKFEERSIRTAWDEEREEWYFSVQDVIAVLAESSDPKQYIKKMRARDPELSANWGTICTLVQMPAADGKMRKIQAANTEGLLRIIQSIPSPRQNLLSVGWPKLAVNASKQRLTQNRQSTVL